ncbi:Type IV secretion system protein VirB6 [Aliarcobacter thereius]|uniref:type IV secretion system protein n=1 Tax=Aliarcobacter thereius TaxID=544718 RepID=UPI0008288FB1|nr:type IV secretion system protein [Aliarcobacter thereius]OCL86004.1 Type IV secretion system protein VirB6 [Aliarcobacter thereius]
MDLQFSQSLSTIFLRTTQEIYKEVFSLSNDILQPFLMPVLTLYFVIVGYQYIFGNINHSKDVLIRLFFIFPILTSIIFNFETYNMYISDPLLNLKDGITNAISSLTAGENIFKWLDTLFIKLFIDVQAKYFKFSFLNMNFSAVIIGLFLIIPFFLIYVYATLYSLQSLVFTNLLLLMGPIFLFFLMFNATKSIFFIWFRALMNYSLYSVILALMLVFIYQAINLSVSIQTTEKDYYSADVYTIFTSFICLIFLKMVPELSNALTQGSISGGQSTNFNWSRIVSSGAKGIAKIPSKTSK